VAKKPSVILFLGGSGYEVVNHLRRLLSASVFPPDISPPHQTLVTMNFDTVVESAVDQAQYAVTINRFVDHACKKGWDEELAWRCVSFSHHGDAGTRFACDMANTLGSITRNDSALLILAMLPDVEPRCERYLTPISARALDPRVVVITSTALKCVERALGKDDWLHNFDFPFPHPTEGEGTRFQKWLALLIGRLLVEDTCLRLGGKQRAMREKTAAVLLQRVLAQWAAAMPERLLEQMWRLLPRETSIAAAALLTDDAAAGTPEILLASAVEGLTASYEGRLQRQVPQFELGADDVRYLAPRPDPWPRFGNSVAALAAKRPELRSGLETANQQLAVWRH
jgi:hypothetical protein